MGFQYTEGNQRFWSKDPHSLPTSFRLRGVPISRAWNVIEGEKNGIRVLILDGVLNLGVKSGHYRTFIAARTDENPFENKSPQEKITHSNGWTTLYRTRFPDLLIPWTLSIQRIEEHLNNLSN